MKDLTIHFNHIILLRVVTLFRFTLYPIYYNRGQREPSVPPAPKFRDINVLSGKTQPRAFIVTKASK